MQAFFSVLPAQAGVIHPISSALPEKSGTPRTSGGDPIQLREKAH